MLRLVRTATILVGVFSVLLGVIYPLVITGIAQLVFRPRANGSLLKVRDRAVGSEMIAQPFRRPDYFHPRPSDCGYDAVHSGSANLGPSNPALLMQAQARADTVRRENGLSDTAAVPADLALASSSGLDPDISPAAARLQTGRVARNRGLEPSAVEQLVGARTSRPFLGVFGRPLVNVLKLNLALDSMSGKEPGLRDSNSEARSPSPAAQ